MVLPGVLVLAPRREFGYLERDQLRTLGVSAHSFFSEEILEGDPKDLSDCKAQCVLSLLMLLANREDRVALRTWCGFGSNNLNANAWAKLREYCEKQDLAPWDTLERLQSGTIAIAYTKPLVERFRLLNIELARLENLRGENLISAVFPADQEWADPFVELKSVIGDEEFGAKDLVALIQRNATQPELPTDVDYVRVMSLHKSKGLTADMVVVVGCLEGLVPFIDWEDSQVEQTRSLEEQRRLFYVAITRARKTLVLSSVTLLPTKSAYRMRARLGRTRGPSSIHNDSRFVGELDQSASSFSRRRFLKSDDFVKQMARKQKLELTWIGKENRPRLEPRILLEGSALSYHAPHRLTENDIFDNRLIFGDNLLALKALEQECTGKIKGSYIDPPYNTGAAFEQYSR